MIQTGLISPAHDDLVTDAAFDYYGTRLATCSLDQKIKIWLHSADGGGAWTLEDQWEAHDAPICSIAWSHPEYGSMIVSGSVDRTTKVWEKLPSFLIEEATDSAPRTKPWKMLCSLTEAKGTVRAVEFCPPHSGLKLAALSTDNILRVYEGINSKGGFTLVDSINVQTLAATPANELEAALMLFATPAPTAIVKDVPAVLDGSWCLSWCKDPHWGNVLAVTYGSSSEVKIIRVCTPEQQTHALLVLSTPSITRSSVTSISWAPSCGRSHQSIATGSKDGHVRIWKVVPPIPSSILDDLDMEMDQTWSGKIDADFPDHSAPITRVQWNTLGTVLTSSGDDGRVRLWKSNFFGWQAVGRITAEKAPAARAGGDAMEL